MSKRNSGKIALAIRRCMSTCLDGQKGYALLAGSAHDPGLRTFFEGASAERAEFAARLRAVLLEIGEEPDGEGTALGALHRVAVDVKLTVTGTSDRMLLEECDRGENAAQHVYEVARSELVRLGTPKPLRDIIDAQYAAVCAARYEIDGRIAATGASGGPRSRR